MCYTCYMAQIGRRTKEKQLELEAQVATLLARGFSTGEIATAVDLKPSTIQRYERAARKRWSERLLGRIESKAELLARSNEVAKAAAQGHSKAKGNSTNAQVAFLRLQLEVIDRIAKLTGAYEAEKVEVTGQNGGAIQMQMVDHAIDSLNADELARRLRNWADALEEASDGQQAVSAVAEAASENV